MILHVKKTEAKFAMNNGDGGILGSAVAEYYYMEIILLGLTHI